jgi:cathepsin A (carboxypeptidase C)
MSYVMCQSTVNANCKTDKFNVYNFTDTCQVPGLCYDFSAVEKFMDSPKTKAVLGMELKGFRWNACNPINEFFLQADMNLDAGLKVAKVLGLGLKVMAYHGELDFICNWEGGLAWTNAVKWEGQDEFRESGVRDVGYG